MTCATTALLSEAGLRSRRVLRMRSSLSLVANQSFPELVPFRHPVTVLQIPHRRQVVQLGLFTPESSNLYTSGWTEQPYRRERSNRSTSVRLEDFEGASEPKKSPSIDSIWLALASLLFLVDELWN